MRSRRSQGQQRLERGKMQLQQLRHRSAIVSQQLQGSQQDRRELELRVSQLQDLAANLTDRIDRDQDRHQQLVQQLETLTLHCQTQVDLAANLDRKIQDKQASCLEVEANLSSLKSGLAQVQSAQLQIQSANTDKAALLVQQKAALIAIQNQINECLATKQELESQLQQLQDDKIAKTSNCDESIAHKHSLLNQLDLDLRDRHKTQAAAAAEIDRLNHLIAQKVPELAAQSQQLVETRSQLSAIELAIQAKQTELTELAVVLDQQSAAAGNYANEQTQDPLSDRLLQRELKIAQLELSSRQAELDNLEFKLHNRLQSINQLDSEISSQSFQPQPPIIDRQIEPLLITAAWSDKFIDNPHLTVLKHIEKHGIITEAEASSKLGNARSVRQFANKLEEYAQDLPFSIRVESSPKGNRYLREERN